MADAAAPEAAAAPDAAAAPNVNTLSEAEIQELQEIFSLVDLDGGGAYRDPWFVGKD